MVKTLFLFLLSSVLCPLSSSAATTTTTNTPTSALPSTNLITATDQIFIVAHSGTPQARMYRMSFSDFTASLAGYTNGIPFTVLSNITMVGTNFLRDAVRPSLTFSNLGAGLLDNRWEVYMASDATLRFWSGDIEADVVYMDANGLHTVNQTRFYCDSQIIVGSNTVSIFAGTGIPNGVSALDAEPGSLYLRHDGAANTSVWIKEYVGTNGWAASGQINRIANVPTNSVFVIDLGSGTNTFICTNAINYNVSLRFTNLAAGRWANVSIQGPAGSNAVNYIWEPWVRARWPTDPYTDLPLTNNYVRTNCVLKLRVEIDATNEVGVSSRSFK